MVFDYNTKKMIDASIVNKDYQTFSTAVRGALAKKVDAIIEEVASNIDRPTDNR
jgi:hypothetical protein